MTGGVDGAVIPAGINTNETLYIVRHAEAHPQGYWSDNNYVGAGQWRALDLPNALRGKISPNQVWSMDPSQFSQGTVSASGDDYWSNVAPALTVEPYAIANNLPYHLVSSFEFDRFERGPADQQFLLHRRHVLQSESAARVVVRSNHSDRRCAARELFSERRCPNGARLVGHRLRLPLDA